jgi:DNA polymerase-3 subunit beta
MMATKKKSRTTPAKRATGSAQFEGHVTANDLAAALARIRTITTRTKRATLPTIACVHLNLRGDKLLATGTDLEATLQLPITAAVETPGIVTVNANRLYSIAKGLGDEALRLRTLPRSAKGEGEDTFLEVKGKTVRYELLTVPPDEYPPTPATPKGTTVQVDRETLTKALRRVRCAIGQDDSRPFLMGVYCEAQGEMLTLTATDGHRLAQQTVPLVDRAKPSTAWLIPEPAIDLIIDLAKKDDDGRDGPIALAGDDKAVEISVGAARLWTQQVEGAFPKYAELVERRQKSTKVRIPKMPTAALRSALTLAGLVAARGSAVAQLSFTPEQVAVFCRDDIGTAEASVAMPWPSAESLQIGFKASYLLDYLEDAPDEVELCCGDNALEPLLFMEPHGLYMAMPIRLDMAPKVEKPPDNAGEAEVEDETEEEDSEPEDGGPSAA